MTPDEKIDEIQRYALGAKAATLKAGELLLECQRQGYWSIYRDQYGNWNGFLSSLKQHTPSYWNRVMRVAKAKEDKALTEEDLQEMDFSVLFALLPLIKKNQLSDQIIAAARAGMSELKAVLSQDKAPKPIEYATCKGCGEEVKCQRCGERVVK
jgi:hypothetical protein